MKTYEKPVAKGFIDGYIADARVLIEQKGMAFDLRERGLPEPKFEEFGDGIKVTIYRKSGSERVNGTTQSTLFAAFV